MQVIRVDETNITRSMFYLVNEKTDRITNNYAKLLNGKYLVRSFRGFSDYQIPTVDLFCFVKILAFKYFGFKIVNFEEWYGQIEEFKATTIIGKAQLPIVEYPEKIKYNQLDFINHLHLTIGPCSHLLQNILYHVYVDFESAILFNIESIYPSLKEWLIYEKLSSLLM